MSHIHNCYICDEDFTCPNAPEDCTITKEDEILCDECETELEEYDDDPDEDYEDEL